MVSPRRADRARIVARTVATIAVLVAVVGSGAGCARKTTAIVSSPPPAAAIPTSATPTAKSRLPPPRSATMAVPAAASTRATAQRRPSPSPTPQQTAILSASASPADVRPGDTERWTVTTTTDVTDVSADVAVYHFRLTRVAPGRFSFAFAVPQGVPPFFHGHYTIGLTARGTAVATASLAVTFE